MKKSPDNWIELPILIGRGTYPHFFQILEMVKAKGMTFCTGLHYEFQEGKWLFSVIGNLDYIMLEGWFTLEIIQCSTFLDLATGGNLYKKIDSAKPDAATVKIILAEIVNAVETLHTSGIFHGDLKSANILIDRNGHLMFTDFGLSKQASDDQWEKACKNDFVYLSSMCYSLFSDPTRNKDELSLIRLLQNMTDDQMPGKPFEYLHFLSSWKILDGFRCRPKKSCIFYWCWLATGGRKEI